MESEKTELSLRDRFSLEMQRLIGWVTFPYWGFFLILLMRVIGRYRIEQIRRVRKLYKRLVLSKKGPVIICANHLTKIDSAIINWSLASGWSYMKSFRFFPWNMPERARYENNIILRPLCYLGSCIPIDRGGDREDVKNSLSKLIYLLRKGHAVTIFPEGKRSRSGELDTEDFSYSVGRLCKAVKNCKVLCVYLRGRHQKNHSSIPRLGERFYMDVKLLKPRSAYGGLRATRDIAAQIVGQLKKMEQAYFATCR